MIDRLLHDEVGDVASKLHTGRSRNDQVATATRMWTMDACARLDVAVRELQQVMLAHAERLQDVLLPAYTHMQRAQPVSASHWTVALLAAGPRRTRIAAAGARRRNAAVRQRRRVPVAPSRSAHPSQGNLGFSALLPQQHRRGRRSRLHRRGGCSRSRCRQSPVTPFRNLILFGSSEFGFVNSATRFPPSRA